MPKKQHDPVNHPMHYTRGDVECIDAIESAVEGLHGADAFLTGQVIKYEYRWRHKGDPRENLLKARWYLNRQIARVEREEEEEARARAQDEESLHLHAPGEF